MTILGCFGGHHHLRKHPYIHIHMYSFYIYHRLPVVSQIGLPYPWRDPHRSLSPEIGWTSKPWSGYDAEITSIYHNGLRLQLARHMLDFSLSLKSKFNTVDERHPAPVEVGSLSHDLQGFVHPWWCRTSSINSRATVPEMSLFGLVEHINV